MSGLALLVLLAAPPEDTAQLFAAGQAAYANEEYEKAMSLFERALAADPKNSSYHLWYGRATGRRAERVIFFRAMGLAKKVGASFEKAVELDPRNVEALTDLLHFCLEAPGLVGGGSEKAPPIAERLAKINPAEGHRAQALILKKKKDWAGAEREYRRALELEPEKLGRVVELASFLAERGRQEEADALFERAAKMDPDSPEYLFARGRQLALAKRNPEEARRLLERYLKSKRRPDDPPRSEVEDLLRKLK
jgi:tetratricopeptide (TPR) repeat protein